ncbi:MAG: alpha/beta hydrolase [bacterium]
MLEHRHQRAGRPPIHPEAFEVRDAGLLFTTGSGAELARFVADWQPPAYAVDGRHRRWATPPVPMLLLNGTLDPQTPHFQLDDAVAAFTGPGQHVRFLEGGAHAVIDYPVDDGFPCGARITSAFVADPAAPLRDACADALGSPAYALDPDLAQLLFNDGAGKRGDGGARRAAWRAHLRARFLALPPPVRQALSRRAP